DAQPPPLAFDGERKHRRTRERTPHALHGNLPIDGCEVQEYLRLQIRDDGILGRVRDLEDEAPGGRVDEEVLVALASERRCRPIEAPVLARERLGLRRREGRRRGRE